MKKDADAMLFFPTAAKPDSNKWFTIPFNHVDID